MELLIFYAFAVYAVEFILPRFFPLAIIVFFFGLILALCFAFEHPFLLLLFIVIKALSKKRD